MQAQNDSLGIITDSLVVADSLLSDTLPAADSHISPDAVKSKVTYTAKDTIKYNFAASKVFLYGDAVVTYEDIELRAAYIELLMDSDIVIAQGVADSLGKMQGTPVYKEGESEIRSQKMTYNFTTKKGKIIDVITQEGEGYIHGEDVKKTEDDIIFIHNGLYTTCAHDHPHFSIAATKLKIIPDDKIVAKPANLVIEDVPTPILLPFGIFPNRDRGKSGILVPIPGESERDGFYLQDFGYYIYISERAELQLEGDIYSKGSYAFRPIYNYKTKYKRAGSLKMRYKYTINGVVIEDPQYSVVKDFWVDWNHRQDPKARPNSTFSANVNMGSTTSYLNDINTSDQDYLTSNFQSKVSYSKYMLQKKLNFSLSGRHNQNNDNGMINLTLPEASLTLTRIYPFKSSNSIKDAWYHKIGVSYTGNFRNELSILSNRVSYENRDSVESAFKNGIAHSIPISTSFKVFKHFTLNPTANYRENWYFASQTQRWDTAVSDTSNPKAGTLYKTPVKGFERTYAYNFSANLTTKIYGMVQMKKGPVKAFRHVITPSVGLTYTPENKQSSATYTKNVYKDTSDNITPTEIEYSRHEGQVYGSLNSAESGRITLGLLNNFEMKVKSEKDTVSDEKKIKILENLRFSSGYDFIADSLKWSNISMSGFTTLSKFVNLQFGGTYDVYALDSTYDGTVYRVDRFEFEETGNFARLTRANFALNFKFTGSKGKKSKKDDPNEFDETREDQKTIKRDRMAVDWDVPWNLGVNYTFDYSKPNYKETITQGLNANGDLSITKNWKFQFRATFDLKENQISYAKVGILRNLHCWEMRMDWVPIGPRQNYSFYIGVKANLLQDLKLEKKEF